MPTLITTSSGVRVFSDWREAVWIDSDLPAIKAKADPSVALAKDIFQVGAAKGLTKVCSTKSEDRITWILFRALEQAGLLDAFLRWTLPNWAQSQNAALVESRYWGRLAKSSDIDPHVLQQLRVLEPFHAGKGLQHTETDWAARLNIGTAKVEAKVNKPGGRETGWEKPGKGPARKEYEQHLRPLVKAKHHADWQTLLCELFQPLRQLMLARLLEHGALERIALVLLINEPDPSQPAHVNRQAFAKLQQALVLPDSQTALVTWQQALAWLDKNSMTQAADQIRVNPLL